MPSDLASGRPMPPRQLFAPGADAVLRLVLWSIVLAIIVAVVGTLAWSYGDFVGSVGVAPEQPVPFSHKHHAGELAWIAATAMSRSSSRRPPGCLRRIRA